MLGSVYIFSIIYKRKSFSSFSLARIVWKSENYFFILHIDFSLIICYIIHREEVIILLYKYPTYSTDHAYLPFKLIGYDVELDKVVIEFMGKTKEYKVFYRSENDVFFIFQKRHYNLNNFRFKKPWQALLNMVYYNCSVWFIWVNSLLHFPCGEGYFPFIGRLTFVKNYAIINTYFYSYYI